MISIILPTYNEKENLEELFQRIDNGVESREYEIVLVDDESPDGTAEKARKLADDYPVGVFVREENHGLSQSVIKGIKYAQGDKLVVMDSDLQHPPEKIPELVDLVNSNDVVIGTRFKGGGEVNHWGLSRNFISRGASIIANFVMWNYDLSDPMSGFFALKKDSVNAVEMDAEGFKILLEILHRNELEVKEVEYTFGRRSEGKSSLGLAPIVDYIEQIGKIILDKAGFKQSKRIINLMEFMAVGGTGVLVNSAIFLGAIYYSLHYSIAGALAFLGALQWNFFWNREITFDKSNRSFQHQYFYFTLVNLGGFVIYEALLFALIGGLNLWAPLANVLAIFGGFMWNFFGSEQIAFK
ncbi:MAG: glycosyltransferase family 2 protein [Candidatus Paceibacterota bacterium]